MVWKGLVAALVGVVMAVGTADAQTHYALKKDARGAWIKNFYPLYDALARQDEATVRRLTPQAEAINAYGEAGATPLSWFMTGFENTPEELRILAHLLDSGADPNQPDAGLPDGSPQRTGVPVLAGRHASAEATQILLDHGLRFDTPEAREGLIEAAAAGNLGFLRAIDAAGMLTEETIRTIPLLAVAALQGEFFTVGYLLDRGAEPNGVRLDGFLPLHWAVLKDQPGVVRRLLQAGADPQLTTAYPHNPAFDGLTALELVEVLRAQAGVAPGSPFLTDVRALLTEHGQKKKK